ncbi:MAG: hypothetical protein ACLTQI_06205 [Slackia sp.]
MIVTGTGKVFCAGGDLRAFRGRRVPDRYQHGFGGLTTPVLQARHCCLQRLCCRRRRGDRRLLRYGRCC